LSKYEIVARGNTRAELMIYGDIGADWMAEESNDAKTVVSKIQGMAKSGVRDLDVRINSYGGSVADGLAIFNALRRFDGNVTTHVDGVSFSIASLMAMGGKTIRMAENALLMIHAPWSATVGNAQEMRRTADVLDKYADAMAGAYMRSGGPDEDSIRAMLTDGEDHYFTAAEAIAAGLVDEITDAVDIAAALRGAQARFNPTAAPAAQQPEAEMADDNTPAAPVNAAATNPADVIRAYESASKGGVDEGVKRENKRQAEIRALMGMRTFSAPQVQAVLEACLADVKCDKVTAMERATQAVELLPENMAISTAANPAADGGHYQATGSMSVPLGGFRQGSVTGGVDRSGDGIRTALEIRSGLITDREVVAKERNSEFLAMSLTDLMARELRMAGHRVGGTREDIARSYLKMSPVMGSSPSHGTDHLTNILADVANKSALMGWDQADETWNQWTQQGTLNDYREAQRANLALLSKLDKMLEHQEWQYGDLADIKQGIQGYFYGKKYGLSIQAIVNDDLGELTRAFNAWGEAGSATVGDAVMALLTATGSGGFGQTMDEDSDPVFHADHSNYVASGSGAAPGETTLNAGYVAMATQTDQNSRTLGIRPRFILHGATLASTVYRQLNSELMITGADATAPNANWVRSLGLQPVQDYRLDAVFSGLGWMLAAGRRTVEVSGVAGPLVPRVERSMTSNSPGIEYEMSLPFGCAVLDYRGLYFNYGA
jgi:ATP-dependent protease ClpP protease subunit